MLAGRMLVRALGYVKRTRDWKLCLRAHVTSTDLDAPLILEAWTDSNFADKSDDRARSHMGWNITVNGVLVVSKSKRLKSNSNDALLNSDDPQAATVIPQAVVTAVSPSTSAVSTVSPMAAYTNCRSDNIHELKYVKARQTTINGTTKGVAVFVSSPKRNCYTMLYRVSTHTHARTPPPQEVAGSVHTRVSVVIPTQCAQT